MKHSPTPSSQTRSVLVNLGNESLEYAVSILANEAQFEHLGFDNVLSICASHEVLALNFLKVQKHWPLLDGLALSILGEKKANIAKFILKTPELREKILAPDLVRLGQLPEIAELILSDPELNAKLNSMQLASLGEHDFTIASRLYHSFFSRIETCDIWRFCRTHRELAAKIISNNDLVEKIEGSDLAKIIELHEDLIFQVLEDPRREKQLGPKGLVILGRHFESVARYLTSNQKYSEGMGSLGVATVAQHHEKLAHEVLEKLSGNALALIGEVHESVATKIFTTPELRKRLNIDDLVLLTKHHLFLAQALLEDLATRKLLSGQQLVILGQAHVQIAYAILQDPVLKQKALEKNIGLLGVKDEDLANLMMSDLSLRDCVQQLDLANLCKNFCFVTQIVIHDETLYKKVSVSYQNLLRERQNVVIALSTFVQRHFLESVLSHPASDTFLPLQKTTTPLPVPTVDVNFIQKFQSLRI